MYGEVLWMLWMQCECVVEGADAVCFVRWMFYT